MRTPLLIRGCGMTTAVGLTAPASCAAIRATGSTGSGRTVSWRWAGPWIVGAAVPLEEPWRGLARLARLVAGPIRECLDAVPDVAPENIPLLLGTPEQHRPGRLTAGSSSRAAVEVGVVARCAVQPRGIPPNCNGPCWQGAIGP